MYNTEIHAQLLKDYKLTKAEMIIVLGKTIVNNIFNNTEIGRDKARVTLLGDNCYTTVYKYINSVTKELIEYCIFSNTYEEAIEKSNRYIVVCNGDVIYY